MLSSLGRTDPRSQDLAPYAATHLARRRPAASAPQHGLRRQSIEKASLREIDLAVNRGGAVSYNSGLVVSHSLSVPVLDPPRMKLGASVQSGLECPPVRRLPC